MLQIPDFIKLGNQIVPPAAGEITGTSGAAKRTAARRDASVPIRAGKTGIEHDFEHFNPKRAAHLEIPCMKTLVPP
jgi:hypothetical protein